MLTAFLESGRRQVVYRHRNCQNQDCCPEEGAGRDSYRDSPRPFRSCVIGRAASGSRDRRKQDTDHDRGNHVRASRVPETVGPTGSSQIAKAHVPSSSSEKNHIAPGHSDPRNRPAVMRGGSRDLNPILRSGHSNV